MTLFETLNNAAQARNGIAAEDIGDYLRILILLLALITFFGLGIQIVVYRKYMLTSQKLERYAAFFIAVGTLYGTTNAYLKNLPITPSTAFTMIGYLLWCTYLLQPNRLVRKSIVEDYIAKNRGKRKI